MRKYPASLVQEEYSATAKVQLEYLVQSDRFWNSILVINLLPLDLIF